MLKGFKIKDNKILCKCGHQIGIIDTKWQHIMKQEIIISGHEHEEIKATDSCYFCKCNNPEPVDENIDCAKDNVREKFRREVCCLCSSPYCEKTLENQTKCATLIIWSRLK